MNAENSNITDSNRTINEFDREFDSVIQNFQRYYMPILVVLGVLGNCLSMYVFLGTKLRYCSSSIYLGALAISDNGYLVIGSFMPWLTLMKLTNIFNWQGFCQFFIYFGSVCSFLSVWLVVAFTVERYIAVRWPLRRQFLCTVVRAKMTVMGLIGLAILLSSPLLFLSRNPKNSNGCGISKKQWKHWASAYNNLDTVLTFIVPLTMIVIFNTLIARNIYKFDHVRRTLTIESDVSNDRAQRHTPRDRMPQTKVTKMLLIVSTVFFFLNMPGFVIRIVIFYGNGSMLKLDWMQQISQILFTTSFGINFILYCVSGQNFRRKIIRMCTKRSNTGKSSRTLVQMTSHEKQCVSEFTRRYSSTKRQHYVDNEQQNCQETQKLSEKGL